MSAVEIPEEVYEAAWRALYEDPTTFCPQCHGRGHDAYEEFWCHACDGRGWVVDEDSVDSARDFAQIEARTALAAALELTDARGMPRLFAPYLEQVGWVWLDPGRGNASRAPVSSEEFVRDSDWQRPVYRVRSTDG